MPRLWSRPLVRTSKDRSRSDWDDDAGVVNVSGRPCSRPLFLMAILRISGSLAQALRVVHGGPSSGSTKRFSGCRRLTISGQAVPARRQEDDQAISRSLVWRCRSGSDGSSAGNGPARSRSRGQSCQRRSTRTKYRAGRSRAVVVIQVGGIRPRLVLTTAGLSLTADERRSKPGKATGRRTTTGQCAGRLAAVVPMTQFPPSLIAPHCT